MNSLNSKLTIKLLSLMLAFLQSSAKCQEFVENKGQIIDPLGNMHSEIKYSAASKNHIAYFTPTGISYVFSKITTEVNGVNPNSLFNRVDLNFLGPNSSVQIIAQNQNPGLINYFLAHIPDGVSAKGYQELLYQNLYPNIDLLVKMGIDGPIYKFILKAGANINNIKFTFNGEQSLNIDNTGNLNVLTALGEINFIPPVAISKTSGIETTISISFIIDKFKAISLNTGSLMQGNISTLTLTGLSAAPNTLQRNTNWVTYYGGASNDDFINDSHIDADGNLYLVGTTESSSFPYSPGAMHTTNAGFYDAVLMKFDGNHVRDFATYYGSSIGDYGMAITTDASGNIYFTGSTWGQDFPKHPTQPASYFYRNWGAMTHCGYIVALNSTGSSKIWVSFIPSSDELSCRAITFDNAGNLYIGGQAEGGPASFAIYNPGGGAWYQSTIGGSGTSDGYIIKFNSAKQMIWGTFLGGSEEDEILGLATNAANSLFVTGYTKSSASAAYTVGTDFPIVAGSGDTYAKQAGQDAFISKFDDNGVLEWSTVFGGNGNDFSLHNIAAGRGSKWGDGYTHKVIGINSVSEVYITGGTSSTNFLNMPSASGDFNRSASAGGVDAFITKFSRDGNLIWSTYFGGNLGDYINAISIDPNDNVYIGGYTSSTNLPTRLINPTYYQIFNPSYSGMTDGFLQIFDNTGNHIWGGYFGGHENDYLCTMAYSSSDEQFYIGGFTKSGTTTMTGKRFPVKAGKHINSYNQLTKSSTNFDGFIGAFSFQPIIELPDARFGRSAEIIEKGDQAFSIKVYPNPSDGLINISFGKAITQTTLEVYNLMGQRIVNKALNDLKADEEIGIDLKSFPKGVYFLRTNGPEGALTGRVMINN